MPGKIFISYRRGDSADFTVALYNELCKLFGEEKIFKDINSIPLGLNFASVLEKALDESSVVLLVIGPGYISDHGHRLFQETDWVRQEVVMALDRDMRVVPILVNGAPLPKQNELPETMQPVINRQAATIDNVSFREDVRRLAQGLSDTISLKPQAGASTPSKGWDNLFKGVLLLVMVFSISLMLYAWVGSGAEFIEKVFMSGLGLSGLFGGWAAFSRQRWLELRSNQLKG